MTDETASLAEREEQFTAWTQQLHTERRHGSDDVLGSLNYIDAGARQRGKSAIKDGLSVSLSRELAVGPNARHDGGFAFGVELFTTTFDRDDFQMRTDRVELDCHGHVNTHIDCLNHLGYQGEWYNGQPLSDPSKSGSVLDFAKFGIFTRGVYVDVAAARGETFITPDRPVTGADIDAALKSSGTTFERGDALLLDCGRDKFEAAVGDWGEETTKPGSGVGAAEWLAENGPSLLLWDMMDAISETELSGTVHQLHWAIGLILVDNCDYAAARPVLAGRSQAVGGLAISPLLIDGATGGNVNPMLIL